MFSFLRKKQDKDDVILALLVEILGYCEAVATNDIKNEAISSAGYSSIIFMHKVCKNEQLMSYLSENDLPVKSIIKEKMEAIANKIEEGLDIKESDGL